MCLTCWTARIPDSSGSSGGSCARHHRRASGAPFAALPAPTASPEQGQRAYTGAPPLPGERRGIGTRAPSRGRWAKRRRATAPRPRGRGSGGTACGFARALIGRARHAADQGQRPATLRRICAARRLRARPPNQPFVQSPGATATKGGFGAILAGVAGRCAITQLTRSSPAGTSPRGHCPARSRAQGRSPRAFAPAGSSSTRTPSANYIKIAEYVKGTRAERAAYAPLTYPAILI